jgi:hypothetical protein
MKRIGRLLAALVVGAVAFGATVGGASADDGSILAGTLQPGEFVLLQIDYPGGDNTLYTINMQVSPDDGTFLQNAGIEVYKPNGGLQVRGGARQSLRPNVSVNIQGGMAGTYVAKVSNSDPRLTMNYLLDLISAPADKPDKGRSIVTSIRIMGAPPATPEP